MTDLFNAVIVAYLPNFKDLYSYDRGGDKDSDIAYHHCKTQVGFTNILADYMFANHRANNRPTIHENHEEWELTFIMEDGRMLNLNDIYDTPEWKIAAQKCDERIRERAAKIQQEKNEKLKESLKISRAKDMKQFAELKTKLGL